MQNKEFEAALVKAKVEFIQHPETLFLSTVCFYLDLVEDESIPTACTNGKQIRFNPQYFLSLSTKQRAALMAHETYHVVYDHMSRRGSRDPKKYNFAGDYRINLDLVEAKFELGPGWLYDEKFKDLSTEAIYDLLPDDPPKNGDDWLDIDSSLPPQEVKEFVEEIIMQAATVARMGGQPGSIPGDIQVYLDGLLKPKLPLSALLRRFFTDVGKNDFTWQRPNKRHAVHGHYLPSQKSGELMHLAFAFDMSGSVSDYDIKRYVTELMNVLRMMKPDKLTLIQFDHGIRSVETIRSVGDMMRVKLTGRGGTHIEPLMEWAVKTKPNALIVFSDGEYWHPQTKPKCPILWLIHGPSRERFHCDFGQTVLFDVGETND